MKPLLENGDGESGENGLEEKSVGVVLIKEEIVDRIDSLMDVNGAMKENEERKVQHLLTPKVNGEESTCEQMSTECPPTGWSCSFIVLFLLFLTLKRESYRLYTNCISLCYVLSLC